MVFAMLDHKHPDRKRNGESTVLNGEAVGPYCSCRLAAQHLIHQLPFRVLKASRPVPTWVSPIRDLADVASVPCHRKKSHEVYEVFGGPRHEEKT